MFQQTAFELSYWSSPVLLEIVRNCKPLEVLRSRLIFKGIHVGKIGDERERCCREVSNSFHNDFLLRAVTFPLKFGCIVLSIVSCVKLMAVEIGSHVILERNCTAE